MSENILDIKKTFLKHLLNTFGIKNGLPPADRTARSRPPIFDDKECSKNVFKKMFVFMSGIFFDILLIFMIGISIKTYIKNT